MEGGKDGCGLMQKTEVSQTDLIDLNILRQVEEGPTVVWMRVHEYRGSAGAISEKLSEFRLDETNNRRKLSIN